MRCTLLVNDAGVFVLMLSFVVVSNFTKDNNQKIYRGLGTLEGAPLDGCSLFTVGGLGTLKGPSTRSGFVNVADLEILASSLD